MPLKIVLDAGLACRIVLLVVMVVLNYVASVETAKIRLSRARGDIGIAITDGHKLFALNTFSDVLLDGFYQMSLRVAADQVLAMHFTVWVCINYSFFVLAGGFMFLFEDYAVGPTVFVGMLMARLCGILYWTPLIPGSVFVTPFVTSFGLVSPPTEATYFFSEHIMVVIVVSGFLMRRSSSFKVIFGCLLSVIMLIVWTAVTRRNYTADVVTSMFASLALLLSADKLKPVLDDVLLLPFFARFDCRQSFMLQQE